MSLTYKIMSSKLTYDKQFVVSRHFHDFLFCFFYIVIVSSCQSFITGNNYRSDFPFFFRNFFPTVKILVAHFRHMTQDSGNLSLQFIKIRLCICQFFSGLTHFCRRDQVHGIGDFHRIFYTVNSCLYFSDICHTLTPALFEFLCNLHDLLGQLFRQILCLLDFSCDFRMCTCKVT